MYRKLITLALVGCFASSAFAADVNTTKAPVGPRQAATYSDPWTGPYGSFGWNYGWGNSNPSVSDPSVSGLSTSCKGYKCQSPYSMGLNAVSDYSSGSLNQRDDGSMVGGGIGYRQRIFNNMVIGGEVELYKSWIEGSSTYNNSQITRKVDSVGLLTAHVGWITPDNRNMLYVKGGGGWRDESISVVGLGSGIGSIGKGSKMPTIGYASGEQSNTDWGWALGGGWEHHLVNSNFNIRLEYMYLKFPDQDTSIAGTITTGSGKGASTGTYAANVHTNDAIQYVGVKAVWHPWSQ